jgi:hypothetical protein
MTDAVKTTWEDVLQLARRVADGEVGDPALSAKRLAALVLQFQADVVHGHDKRHAPGRGTANETPAASTTRPVAGTARRQSR